MKYGFMRKVGKKQWRMCGLYEGETIDREIPSGMSTDKASVQFQMDRLAEKYPAEKYAMIEVE